MAKILVIFYSMYGHTETMAKAVVEGAANVAGTSVTLKRVPRTNDAGGAAKSGGKKI